MKQYYVRRNAKRAEAMTLDGLPDDLRYVSIAGDGWTHAHYKPGHTGILGKTHHSGETWLQIADALVDQGYWMEVGEIELQNWGYLPIQHIPATGREEAW